VNSESYIFRGQQFDWNIDKALNNIKKHGIPFKEAATVFGDDNAVILEDESHSQDEERFKIMGISGNARILMVCHCHRDEDTVIRIISAREASNNEINLYNES